MNQNAEFTSTIDTSVQGLKGLILSQLRFTLARDPVTASKRDWWLATSKAVQCIVIERLMATQTRHRSLNSKRLYYLSLEFLMGRLYVNNFLNTGVFSNMETAIKELGLTLNELRAEEYDMGLGNGGLGRLAACFLDSLATLDLPAIGYGIHYQYGLFRQEFRNGYQVELPDDWMKYGTPWEIVRPEHTTEIEIYGQVENVFDDLGNSVPRWTDTRKIMGIPYDIPIPGYGTNTVNFLRLWESRATEEFNFEAFNRGGYEEAVREKNSSTQTISSPIMIGKAQAERIPQDTASLLRQNAASSSSSSIQWGCPSRSTLPGRPSPLVKRAPRTASMRENRRAGSAANHASQTTACSRSVTR